MTRRHDDGDVLAQAREIIARAEHRHRHIRLRRHRPRPVVHHPLLRAVLDRQPYAIAAAIITLTIVGVAIGGLIALTVGP